MKQLPIAPGPNQESVWDYPRPPAVERCNKRYRVLVDGHTVADTTRAYRILETSHPPTIYIPPDDVEAHLLVDSLLETFCEFKGMASYKHIQSGERTILNSCWYYKTPNRRFAMLQDHFSFYPSRTDECYVNEELVIAQQGDFYGGWVTSNIVGPFKGGPGTWGW